ncbi:SIMPL domain-containing protein [Aurantiacibacter sp. D1-12]|uniref:SIMPL domain-containing protein n=1 Tax=Aurantiacibacter sp. D1-12 TaxID=2993658 RepID=UPI00237CCD04|nr:SIMPL domain-containing protein [Aurantiacibacter sp. D1-12]MDE1468384.1 SIMPL domain-containing protein [Aurantiacibacter sp. D1-12]
MNRMGNFLVAAMVAIGLATLAQPGHAQSMRGLGAFAMDPANDGNAILSITGRGSVPSPPDVAVFTAGIETTGATAQQALAENSRVAQRLMSTLDRAGIAPRDIQTSRISLRPIMSNERNSYARNYPTMMMDGANEAAIVAEMVMADAEANAAAMVSAAEGEEPRIIGYRASNTITIRQRNLEEYGSLVDALVAAGANTVNGPRFTLEDSESVEREARDLAIANARREAEEYAAAAGLRVYRIMMIEQGQTSGLSSSSNAQFGFYEAMSSDAMYAPPPPSAPGELNVTVSVGILFELTPT